MIKSVHDYQIDDVFKKDAGFCYIIPKYQRDYTWNQYNWKDLYDDICENDYGYFIYDHKSLIFRMERQRYNTEQNDRHHKPIIDRAQTIIFFCYLDYIE